MEAFCPMILRTQPPVGRRLNISEIADPPEIAGYCSAWLNSGTAALSLGISLARAVVPVSDTPQVILPAYGCPDLVAAAVYAGVEPVLVDINPDDPSYNLKALSNALSDRVVAVVAVNFLGVRERLTEVVATVRAASSKALIIEDNAQWFPEFDGAPGALALDISLTSFGRGKPVNIMGGGVLWARNTYKPVLQTLLHELGSPAEPRRPGVSFQWRAKVFNALLHPVPFYWLSRIPALKVGATEYHALEAIAFMDAERLGQVSANIAAYLAEDRWREQAYRRELERFGDLDLASALSHRAGRLLRYPILLPDQQDCNVKHYLVRANLGMSPLYQRPLIAIPGVEKTIRCSGNYPGAEKFARRLLTLPLHLGITLKTIGAIRNQLQRWL